MFGMGGGGRISSLSATPWAHPGQGGGDTGPVAFSTIVNLQTISLNKGQHRERETHGKQMNKQDQLWWG